MIKASKQLRSYTLSTVTAVHSPLKNQKEMDNRVTAIWIHFQRTFKSTGKKIIIKIKISCTKCLYIVKKCYKRDFENSHLSLLRSSQISFLGKSLYKKWITGKQTTLTWDI